jgi:hypothetical protein
MTKKKIEKKIEKKIGMTSNDFVETVEKTGAFSSHDVVGLDANQMIDLMKESGGERKTDFIKLMQKRGINEFAIGYSLCQMDLMMKEAKEKIGMIMEAMEQAQKQFPEKQVTAKSMKKLSYIE